MNNRMKSVRMGFVALAGVMIVLGGWLATGPVARADDDDHDGGWEVRALADHIADAKLTLVGAIQAAEKATGGTAVKAKYELEDNGLEVEVHVLVGEKIKEVGFDAMTGKRLKHDDGDEGHEHKGDDDKDEDHEGGHEDND